MGEEFLSKIKGNNATFVIHSDAGACAAAAVMGNIAVRSQEEGSYFCLSDDFIPMVDDFASKEFDANTAPDQIDVNFKNDWIEYLKNTGFPANSLEYKDCCTPEENTMRFLNVCRRIPAMKPRMVHESRELSIPNEYRLDYEKLMVLIKTGDNLNPYLSRDILKKKNPDKNDLLLNSWGIQHLHFRTEGTDQLLFCVIAESDVFVIQALPHNEEYLWVNTQLVEILHRNWPKLILRAKHNGLDPEDIQSAKRHSLRRYNANFLVTVSDGTVYLPLAVGTMASGDSMEDWVNCKKIFSELEHYQNIVVQNALAIRTALNMPASQKLVVRIAFDNRVCCLYEPTRATRIGGFTSTHSA
ncbi:hypothetical protein B0F88_1211 [Methylobacter tundripaludum]|uniref:Uncharacterized protein n=1 Tax=Methylobacter tundripaludum TaxID=173365 RepID=A0A2S6GJE1_9GAMM|nr:hypothetical protein [Methylobacter tundripaludum]PPK65313.1 hypothetical protein B0F88_1211 [Methylobacter tundripaludum]